VTGGSKKPGAPTPPSGQYNREDLLKAYKDLVHEAQEKATHREPPPESPPSHRAFWITVLLVLMLSLGSVLFYPQWYFPPQRHEDPILTDASLRLAVHREILRIEQYKKASGRLPATLKEAGGGETGVQYTINGEDYTLTARSGSISVSYQSGTPPEQFLGDAYERVRRRK